MFIMFGCFFFYSSQLQQAINHNIDKEKRWVFWNISKALKLYRDLFYSQVMFVISGLFRQWIGQKNTITMPICINAEKSVRRTLF